MGSSFEIPLEVDFGATLDFILKTQRIRLERECYFVSLHLYPVETPYGGDLVEGSELCKKCTLQSFLRGTLISLNSVRKFEVIQNKSTE